MGSHLEEFRLVEGLFRRLFIVFVVIAVRKRSVSMLEALFEIETPCFSLSLRNL